VLVPMPETCCLTRVDSQGGFRREIDGLESNSSDGVARGTAQLPALAWAAPTGGHWNRA